MRNAFLDELLALAAEDPSVMLLTGDLGFMVLEPFAERFPERFYNVGVAEQNMVGLATGLAEAGFRPFVYSIATFATLRPYEFIRNGPALHDLPVRVVGVGGGFDYAHNGVTHHALEDLAVMRAQPRMAVIAPADPGQARSAIRTAHALPGPVYFRIGKGPSAVPGLDDRFDLGRLEIVREGGDVALIATGAIASETIEAARLLARHGIEATVAICASLAPAPLDDIAALLERVPVAVTHEAAYVNGGLGSLVSEVVAEQGLPVRVTRCAVREMPSGATGSAGWLQERYGISAKAVAGAVEAALDQAATRA
ncbi:MAG: transketolase [Solirubrobacteraceae bacterium]|nr:transketolase [Solirubrobacteraceae bacterium]MEA2182975.1 transketolase [Solirubrobacteraceae bacterium]MEA2186987.1 transketolase [Solirubrobacteraceae bacterium]